MSIQLPSRGVLRTATAIRTASTTLTSGTPTLSSALLGASTRCRFPPHTQVRALWGGLFGSKTKSEPNKPATTSVESHQNRKELVEQMKKSSMAKDSIFSDELGGEKAAKGADDTRMIRGGSLLKEHLARAVDPDPRSRVRWQRKMVVRHVARNLDLAGREPREERLARTERRLLVKSAALPTSTKKLMHLARQVAGKTVDEALVQMRFSTKKMARAVRWHLEEARDLAVVERGMGLGPVNGEVLPDGQGVKIRTREGRWTTVQDPTRLYVEQAWVNRAGIRHVRYKIRARSQAHRLTSPSTFLSLVLKEEKTRIRQHQEREDKKARKAPWVHLPSRPVTAQRPYYSW